jgi:hypothetical protein
MILKNRSISSSWGVRRQLFFPVNDNYFSLLTTITGLAKFRRSPKLVLAAAEDRAMQGCNPSTDCGACTVIAGAGPKVRRPGGKKTDTGRQGSRKIPGVWGQSPQLK